MTNLIAYLQVHLRTVVAVCFALLAVIASSTFLIDTHQAHTWVEQHIPFFWSFFGFAAAAVIIGTTRWLGRSGIQARTDFYACPTSTSCEEE